jgi:hypothetical protein
MPSLVSEMKQSFIREKTNARVYRTRVKFSQERAAIADDRLARSCDDVIA